MTAFLAPSQLPTAQAALRDAAEGSPDARWVAAQALGLESGDLRQEAIAALKRLLSDPCEEIRAQALEGLAEQATQGVVVETALVERGLRDPAPAVRCAAVDAALMVLADPAPAIISMAGDPDSSVRMAAGRAIGSLHSDEGIPALRDLLNDSVSTVRFEAAVALAESGDHRGERELLSALRNRGENAREAARALGLLSGVRGAPVLQQTASRYFSATDLKAMSAAALVRCGESELGTAILEKLLASGSSDTKLIVLTTLAQLPVAGLAIAVGRLLDCGDPVLVSAAIHTLACLATEEREAPLKELERRRSTLGEELNPELEECLTTIRSLI